MILGIQHDPANLKYDGKSFKNQTVYIKDTLLKGIFLVVIKMYYDSVGINFNQMDKVLKVC